MYLKKWYNGADHEFFQATHETMSLFVSGLLDEFVTDMFPVFGTSFFVFSIFYFFLKSIGSLFFF